MVPLWELLFINGRGKEMDNKSLVFFDTWNKYYKSEFYNKDVAAFFRGKLEQLRLMDSYYLYKNLNSMNEEDAIRIIDSYIENNLVSLKQNISFFTRKINVNAQFGGNVNSDKNMLISLKNELNALNKIYYFGNSDKIRAFSNFLSVKLNVDGSTIDKAIMKQEKVLIDKSVRINPYLKDSINYFVYSDGTVDDSIIDNMFEMLNGDFSKYKIIERIINESKRYKKISDDVNLDLYNTLVSCFENINVILSNYDKREEKYSYDSSVNQIVVESSRNNEIHKSRSVKSFNELLGIVGTIVNILNENDIVIDDLTNCYSRLKSIDWNNLSVTEYFSLKNYFSDFFGHDEVIRKIRHEFIGVPGSKKAIVLNDIRSFCVEQYKRVEPDFYEDITYVDVIDRAKQLKGALSVIYDDRENLAKKRRQNLNFKTQIVLFLIAINNTT